MIRILVPLVVTDEQFDEGLAVIEAALASVPREKRRLFRTHSDGECEREGTGLVARRIQLEKDSGVCDADTATKPGSAAVEFKDQRLFREACYIDGQWIQANRRDVSRSTILRPAKSLPTCRNSAPRKRDKPSRRRTRRFLSGARRLRKSGRSFWALVRFDDGESGRSGSTDDARARQTARANRAVRSRTPLRFSNGSPKKRSAFMATRFRQHQADKRIVVIKQPVGVVACDHAVEFSAGHDHAQGGSCAGGAAARWCIKPADADAIFCACACRARGTRGRSKGRFQCDYRARPRKLVVS